MSRSVKKKVIGLAAGIAIVGGSVTTAVILANLANANVQSYIVTYDNLLKIYNEILANYSKNATNINTQCTTEEFITKVKSGEIKKWINENFSDYFKAIDSGNLFDFNLEIKEENNLIVLKLIPTENKTLRLDQFSDKYDASIVEFNKNSIIFKFQKSHFFNIQLFNEQQLNSFKNEIILQMQQNKLTFENLSNIKDSNQINEIIHWICKLLKIKNIFESVQFNKLPTPNAYSINLVTNNDYVIDWINNESNSPNFIIERKSLTINFNNVINFENNVLNSLKEKVSLYFQQKNIDYLTWLEHFENQDTNYQELINYIYNELNQLINNNLVNNYIDSIQLLTNDNNEYSLKIIPSAGYSFLSDSDYYDNGNIILKNIDIYSYIEFTDQNLESFYSKLQQRIDMYKYKPIDFSRWVLSDEFKDYLAVNLKTSNNINLEISKISNIEYDIDNNIIKIVPNSMYRFKILSFVQNVTVDANGALLISNLNLFEYLHFSKLSELYNGVQEYIDAIKFTENEFIDYVANKDNIDNLKNLVAEHLLINDQDKINVNKISNINFENNNLLVTLDDDHTIYSYDLYQNITITNNVLSISNLKFFNSINLIKLNELFSSIQNFIINNKYTLNEFDQYIVDYQENFKTFIANNLFINETQNISISEILDINLDNNDLKITLNTNYIKYNLEENQNFEFVDSELVIKNLVYYSTINFIDLDTFYDFIQDDIIKNQYTTIEFENYLATDLNTYKNLLANNLSISTTEKLDADKILEINFIPSSKELKIILDDNYLKYSINTNSNITLTDTTLTISNLEFYETINLLNTDNLFTKIQEYIDANKLTPIEFQESVNGIKNDLIKDLIANNLYISDTELFDVNNIVSINVNEHYQLEIVLNSNYLKYHLEQNPNSNVNFVDNILTISNLNYYSSINILNIEEAYNYFEKIINDNQFTPSEFIKYLTDNQLTIKNDLADKIYISENNNLDVNDILNIRLNSSNNLEITLNGINKKYIINQYQNATIINNPNDALITIKNLHLWTNINFSNMAAVRNGLQNLITNSSFTQTNFSDYIGNNQNEIKTLISNSLSKSISGPGSWSVNQISNVQYTNNSVRITFNPPTYYKYSANSETNSSFANNVLAISSFSFYSPLSTSYFTWSGSSITGLSSSGQNLTEITIPTNCTFIGAKAFYHNTKITSVTIPFSVQTIGDSAFDGCTSLRTLKLSEGVQTIGQYAFANNRINAITIPKTVSLIKIRAFVDNLNLDYVYIYSPRIRLDDGCFSFSVNNDADPYCYFYEIFSPDYLSIDNYAFANAYRCIYYVKNTTMKNWFEDRMRNGLRGNGVNIF